MTRAEQLEAQLARERQRQNDANAVRDAAHRRSLEKRARPPAESLPLSERAYSSSPSLYEDEIPVPSNRPDSAGRMQRFLFTERDRDGVPQGTWHYTNARDVADANAEQDREAAQKELDIMDGVREPDPMPDPMDTYHPDWKDHVLAERAYNARKRGEAEAPPAPGTKVQLEDGGSRVYTGAGTYDRNADGSTTVTFG